MARKFAKGREGFAKIVHPFALYRKIHNISVVDFAAAIDCGANMVNQVERWVANPSPRLAKRAELRYGIKKETVVWPEEYFLADD